MADHGQLLGVTRFIDMYLQLTTIAQIAQGYADKAKPTEMSVNHYHLDGAFTGELLATFEKIVAALNLDNHDRSDAMVDHFDVGHYVSVHLGRWNKPFVVQA